MTVNYRKRCYTFKDDHAVIRYGMSAEEMGEGWHSINRDYENSNWHPKRANNDDDKKGYYFSETLSSDYHSYTGTVQNREGSAFSTIAADQARWRTRNGFTDAGKEKGGKVR